MYATTQDQTILIFSSPTLTRSWTVSRRFPAVGLRKYIPTMTLLRRSWSDSRHLSAVGLNKQIPTSTPLPWKRL
ncbi:hypothetical protein FOXYSP1_06694 [Fusarium oxysporum f. sp. phaseoli]